MQNRVIMLILYSVQKHKKLLNKTNLYFLFYFIVINAYIDRKNMQNYFTANFFYLKKNTL